ncbi:MAG: hypothetical protein KGM95_01165 [Betaproteobacteria bacterium]|nr:hypothetical protein [Betaproteobacteria bacterium]
MNKFTSVLAAIALAATSSASPAVEETDDKRNAHRTHTSKEHVDKAKTPSGEAVAHAERHGAHAQKAGLNAEKDQKK